MAVFEKGSIIAASEVVNLTPSAVSQALALFEKEVGFRLFQRFPRKLIPTDQASELHGYLRTRLEDFDCFIASLRSGSHGEPSGTLKIGAPPEFGSRQVTQAISKFKSYSKAKFHLKFGLPDQLIASVVAGELDLAFCDEGPYLSRYKTVASCEPVFSEAAILVCSEEFYLKHVQDNLTYNHLSSLPHIDYRTDAKVLALWYRHSFGRAPSNLDIRFAADNVNAIIRATVDGLGLGFLPKHLIVPLLKTGALKEIKIKKREYINPIHLVRVKAKVPSTLEREFVKSLDFSKV